MRTAPIVKSVRRLILSAMVALLVSVNVTVLPSTADNAAASAMRGFPSALASRELGYERAASASPNAQTAAHDEVELAGHVHRMGQPADYQTALYVRNRLAADGFDAKIVTYDVGIVWPTEQRLEITAPFVREVDLYEPAVPGDPYSRNHEEIGKPYSGFSNDGDAEGPLVYANYGRAQDFALLKHMHVSLAGAIVIAKMGHGSADSKGRRVASYGGKALLIYPEPGYDPFLPPKPGTKPYPNGPARPLGAALRNTMLIEYNAGDPTAIGIPLPGAKHKPFSTLLVPPIPVSAVTALVAQQLESSLGGTLAPRAWATKTVPNVRLGGVERVHYVLKSHRFIGPIWDVIATMRGSSAANESVIIGGHRDAWTYGAVDPTSGTVAMLQFGDALRKLRAVGWRPFRTIVVGSWDGEELNDFGSAAWVQQNAERLRRSCWAYVNTDEVAMGPTFYAGATDDLTGIIRSVADVAVAPGGTALTPYWAKQDASRTVSPQGEGSDHEPFTYHLGIPSSGIAYAGPFGTYHSAYDDPASLRVLDPGMRYADAAARFYTIEMLRLADAPYPDLRLSDLALALQHRLNAFANGSGDEARRTNVVRALEPWIAKFSQLSQSIDSSVDESAAANNLGSLEQLRSLAFTIRSKFYDPSGIPGQPWQGSLMYNYDDVISTLPSLETTLDPKLGDRALNQLLRSFQSLPPLLLIYEVRHTADVGSPSYRRRDG